MTQLRASLLIVSALALAAPALAQRYPGGRGAWLDSDERVATQANAEPSKHVDVETFRAADAAPLLGKGRIVVVATPPVAATAPADPSALPGNDDSTIGAADKLPVYEAAVIDQLAGKGYDVATADHPAQQVEIAVSHDVVLPEEAPHRPVSGAMSVGVSNRGSGFGLALAIDLSKPKKAIIATRIDVRIRDAATHRVLWEGHAEGQARASDKGNDDTRMATRLSTALFAKFPEGKVVQDLPGVAPLTPPQGAGE